MQNAFALWLYSCSPRRVSRKLWTVHEMVSCMQQLRERYASRTCYYAHASLWRQHQGLNYAQSQPTVSSTLMHRFQFLLTRRGKQEYSIVFVDDFSTHLKVPTSFNWHNFLLSNLFIQLSLYHIMNVKCWFKGILSDFIQTVRSDFSKLKFLYLFTVFIL